MVQTSDCTYDRFNNYFILDTTTAIEYVKYKLKFFSENETLECEEIGDGNINYVYRVRDCTNNKSLILKQAGSEARISKELIISKKRGKTESDSLMLLKKLSPDNFPQVYMYDNKMCIIAMQDMVGHIRLRDLFMSYKTCDNFSAIISNYFAKDTFLYSNLHLDSIKLSNLKKKFINRDICKITEDLVFTQPYQANCTNNILLPENQDFISNEIYNDEELKLEVAKFKFKFMTNSQTLIHGDFHTGSIFANEEHLFIFDTEFSFFGPIGYDIGTLIANLIFSWFYVYSCNDNSVKSNKFCKWIMEQIVEIIDKYSKQYYNMFNLFVTDPMAKCSAFREEYLKFILQDTASSAGVELIRRIVGLAKVPEISKIESLDRRIEIERKIILLAKLLIKNNNKFADGSSYKYALEEIIKQNK